MRAAAQLECVGLLSKLWAKCERLGGWHEPGPFRQRLELRPTLVGIDRASSLSAEPVGKGTKFRLRVPVP